MTRPFQIGFALTILVCGGALLWHSFDPSYGSMGIGSAFSPVFFPQLLLGFWLLFGLIVLVEAFQLPKTKAPRRNWTNPAALAITLTAAIFALKPLGYLVVSMPLAFLSGWCLGFRRPVWLAAIAVISGVFGWWLFDRALGIPLPRGRIW